MTRRDAEEFERGLQALQEGERAEGPASALVQTARAVSGLVGPVPPAPGGLAAGRQRLLAEAARLRAQSRPQRAPGVRWAWLAPALAALLLVFGLVAAQQASAGSLPGQPLFGLKLAFEAARRGLTLEPASRAQLDLSLTEERLEEIEALLAQGTPVEESAARRAEQYLFRALESAAGLEEPASAQVLTRLELTLEQREREMLRLAGDAPAGPIRELIRQMVRVRAEVHAGLGDPQGLRERLRHGIPPEPSITPPPNGTPHRTAAPSMTPQPSGTPHRTAAPSMTPQPSGTPHRTAAPSMTPQPSATPHRTAAPSMTPQPSATPHRTAAPSATPQWGSTPHATATPGSGGGGNKP